VAGCDGRREDPAAATVIPGCESRLRRGVGFGNSWSSAGVFMSSTTRNRPDAVPASSSRPSCSRSAVNSDTGANSRWTSNRPGTPVPDAAIDERLCAEKQARTGAVGSGPGHLSPGSRRPGPACLRPDIGGRDRPQ
jgi:hypothetical protein